MSLKLKLFFILSASIILSNHLTIYLSSVTQIPHLIINCIFVILICWALLSITINYIIFRLNLLDKYTNAKPQSLEQIFELIKILNGNFENSQKMLSEFMNIISDDFLVLEPKNFIITHANISALKIFGKDSVGKSLGSIHVFSKMFEALNVLGVSNECRYNSFITSFNNNIYKASIRPYIWCGEIKYYFLILRNINLDMELEIKVREYNVNISHQIKTPVTSILNASDILLQDEITSKETLKEFLPMIYKQAKKLAKFSKLMNSLWEAKIAEAKIQDSNELNLQQLINKVLYNLKDVLINNSIHISIDGPRASLPYVTGKPLQLLELLTQLIENLIATEIKSDYLNIRIRVVRLKTKLLNGKQNFKRALKVTIRNFVKNNILAHQMLKPTLLKKPTGNKIVNPIINQKLNILHKIIKQHKAKITINNIEGIGSEYFIYFKLTE